MVQTSMIEMPDQFFVKERWVSWTIAFDIETAQSKLGVIRRRFFGFTTQYDFYNLNEQLQATAKARFWALGAIFDVMDAEGQLLGGVRERLLTTFPTFEILSTTGEVLAVAKMNFWNTIYTVKDPVTSQVMAQLSHSIFFRLKDNWSVTVINPELLQKKQIDPRFFIIVMVFQTDHDYWSDEFYSRSKNDLFRSVR
jgi:uncharacterized protein YxjI